jgi:hypothetical protein
MSTCKPIGLANNRVPTNYAQKSPRSLLHTKAYLDCRYLTKRVHTHTHREEPHQDNHRQSHYSPFIAHTPARCHTANQHPQNNVATPRQICLLFPPFPKPNALSPCPTNKSFRHQYPYRTRVIHCRSFHKFHSALFRKQQQQCRWSNCNR